jgi:hypothetical protein
LESKLQDPTLLTVIEAYAAFVRFTTGDPETVVEMPTLYVLHGQTPRVLTTDPAVLAVAEEEEIDWTKLMVVEAADSLKEEGKHALLDTNGGGGGDIDWGDSSTATDVLELLEDSNNSNSRDLVLEDSKTRLSLEHESTRALCLQELAELSCFLAQRQAEIAQESTSNWSVSAPSQLVQNMQDKPLVDALADYIKSLQKDLRSNTLAHFFKLQQNQDYLDSIHATLTRKQGRIQAGEQQVLDMTARRQRVSKTLSADKKRLGLLQTEATELKKLLEASLSEHFENRPVHIFAQI